MTIFNSYVSLREGRYATNKTITVVTHYNFGRFILSNWAIFSQHIVHPTTVDNDIYDIWHDFTHWILASTNKTIWLSISRLRQSEARRLCPPFLPMCFYCWKELRTFETSVKLYDIRKIPILTYRLKKYILQCVHRFSEIISKLSRLLLFSCCFLLVIAPKSV